MKEKMFEHSPKGMSEVPNKAGEYMLLDSRGNDIGQGWKPATNLRRKIKEEHYLRHKKFSYIKTRKR